MEERLPLVTRFPQRAKSANPSEPETSGKKQHVKRPSLELVDSHSFVTDEKDKSSKSGPRIIETELSKSEVFETVSKSSVEYAQSTTETSVDDDEDTTPLMEKLAIDLYAILANENAKEDDKKSKYDEATTVSSDDDATTEFETEKAVPSTAAPSSTTTTTTTTTTQAPTTTTTEAPRGRGALTAGRTNRFKFQPKSSVSTEAPAEAPSTDSSKPKNRFNRPSSTFSGRSSSSRATKTTSAPEEVKENVEKSEAPAPSKLGSKTRNRFNVRNPSGTTTEKLADPESTTVSRLLKPRPQFSLRNRSRNGGAAAASTTESNDVTEAVDDKEEKPAEKASSIVPRPTSRLNINRPANRVVPSQKARTSPLSSRRVTSNDDNNDGHKSANENESDLETTTQNNLNKLKSRPRIQINADSKAKKTASSPVVVNRKVNPLISKRKFGVTSTTGTFCIFI